MPAQPRSPSAEPDPVRLEGVGFGYADGPEVLRAVNLNLTPGSFHFLTGPSGAGKSTLLRLLTLIERPTAGRLSLFGRDAAQAPRGDLTWFRRRMGVVFQDFRLLDHLSAFDNVALPLRLAGAKPDAYAADVREMLEWVGLGHKLDHRPPTLSGGEKQRVAIARAVIGRPDLIVADEPTGSVDAPMAQRLLRLFQSLNQSGVTVLVATHDARLAQSSGARVLTLAEGALR